MIHPPSLSPATSLIPSTSGRRAFDTIVTYIHPH